MLKRDAGLYSNVWVLLQGKRFDEMEHRMEVFGATRLESCRCVK